MQISVSQPKPKVVVTSASTFWNSKDAVENQVALSELGHLKAQQADQLEIGAVTYNEGFGSKVKRRASGLVKGLPAALLGAGAVTVAMTAGLLTVPVALGVAGLASAGLSLGWLATGLQGAVPRSEIPTGLSLQHSGFESLEFPKLKASSTSAEALREMALSNMKHYPSSMQVVHLNGHGHGAQAVAGLAGDDAGEALGEVVRQAQRKFDVGYYETCYGANFELLHGHSDAVSYAVAFEDAIPKSNNKLGRIPLAEVLGQAVDAASSREAALRMAQFSGRHFDSSEPLAISSVPLPERLKKSNKQAMWTNTDSTAVAVDLKVLREELSPALDRAGRELKELLNQRGARSLLAEARSQNALESSGDLIDLGGFLKSVGDGLEQDSAGYLAVNEALQALEKSIFHKRTGKDFPLSGLSFHSQPDKVRLSDPASPAHGDPSLPKAWVEFVKRAF